MQETSPAELIKQAALRDNPDKEFTEAPDLEIDLVEHKLFYEIESLKQNLVESQETHKLRLNYSGKIFFLVCAWLVCVAVAVFLAGFSYKDFSLSDKVLIAFITSTTINVVGLFVVVAKWMFPTIQNNNKSS